MFSTYPQEIKTLMIVKLKTEPISRVKKYLIPAPLRIKWNAKIRYLNNNILGIESLYIEMIMQLYQISDLVSDIYSLTTGHMPFRDHGPKIF
ncbi:hypothetical protein Glove_606g63 [Diversispora epigaea]|uniref:Uncharacterized protein n=1 Tax=Diversispora epigaea TaxID=1348612 RepID=A0A397G7A0_9GLOM|nr:hypothetical protein Glove_606g63 [Diversispora epigaea]